MKHKRLLMLFVLSLTSLFLVQTIYAAACNLDVSLINQDPYPANPGDYVKVVFKITGLENPECKSVIFEVKEKFPFTLDPGKQNPITFEAGTYNRDYSSYYLAPYDLRVSEDALNGDNEIEVSFGSTTGASSVSKLKKFSINVEDTIADFEIFIKNYVAATNIMTFEILNIGETDIKAVTVEIPKQVHIEIKGPNRNIVGDIDSNEYTTADFEAISSGGNIDLQIYYTDTVDVRRNINKTIFFNPFSFQNRAADKSSSSSKFIFIIVIVAVITLIIYRRHKRKKHRSVL